MKEVEQLLMKKETLLGEWNNQHISGQSINMIKGSDSWSNKTYWPYLCL